MSDDVTRIAMVVDDDPVVRRALTRATERFGFVCREFASGEEALAQAEEIQPHLAIIDIEMPGIDGFETTRALRERVGESVAIIVATGHTDRETIERAFVVGASDFITKPVDWVLLQHRIRFQMRAHDAFYDLAQSERRLAQAQEIANIGHWEWQQPTGKLICSNEARRILDLEDVGNISIDMLIESVHPEERDTLRAHYARAVEGRSWSVDHRLASNDTIVVRQQVRPLTNEAGKTIAVAGTIQDITDRHRAAEQIRRLSYHDTLTGLPNGRMVEEHIDDLAILTENTENRFALLWLKLDRFEELTLSIGPDRRDELLLEFTARMELRLETTGKAGAGSKSDLTFARVGSDTFAVVIRDCDVSDRPFVVARDIVDLAKAPYTIDGSSFDIPVSIGIATCPEDGQDATTLIHSAEVALRDAQHSADEDYRCANPQNQEFHARRLAIQLELRDAFDNGQLVAAYQPQWSSSTGEIVGVELLSRWFSPSLSTVSPGEFVPIAEESGLIAALSHWTLRAACKQLRVWIDAGVEPLRVSINLSPRFVEKPEAVTFVHDTIREFEIDPALLECEFTETAMVGSPESMIRAAAELRALGVRTALDDFGTGFSSLQHLVGFPLDCVKIDLSFVQRIEDDAASRSVCAALIAMARELELEVVAEGVETEAQRDFLTRQGCELLQGYLLSPAVDAEACIEMRDRGAGLKANK